MANVEISVEGLALWIRRASEWEVLFPRSVGENEQHLPYLTITNDGVVTSTVRQSLEDLTLLTSGLQVGTAPSVGRPDWMLGLRSTRDAAARASSPATSTDVVASLILPLQAMERKSRLRIGPVSFNGGTCYLDYGTVIRLACPGPASLLLRTKGETTGGTPILLEAETSTSISVKIENLTDRDQWEECGETRHRDHLMEADDLLSLCDMQVAVPRYFGRDLKEECVAAGIARAMGGSVENPWRLCPQGYCEDCPPD